MTQLKPVSKKAKILFPLMVLVMTLLLPAKPAAPLVGMFCLGNLMRESGVVDRLSKTAQNELINLVTIFLGLARGCSADCVGVLDHTNAWHSVAWRSGLHHWYCCRRVNGEVDELSEQTGD